LLITTHNKYKQQQQQRVNENINYSNCNNKNNNNNWRSTEFSYFLLQFLYSILLDLGGPFFPGGPELWHHPLAYSAAAAAELPGAAALQHATLVHPALHPQVPVRSYL